MEVQPCRKALSETGRDNRTRVIDSNAPINGTQAVVGDKYPLEGKIIFYLYHWMRDYFNFLATIVHLLSELTLYFMNEVMILMFNILGINNHTHVVIVVFKVSLFTSFIKNLVYFISIPILSPCGFLNWWRFNFFFLIIFTCLDFYLYKSSHDCFDFDVCDYLIELDNRDCDNYCYSGIQPQMDALLPLKRYAAKVHHKYVDEKTNVASAMKMCREAPTRIKFLRKFYYDYKEAENFYTQLTLDIDTMDLCFKHIMIPLYNYSSYYNYKMIYNQFHFEEEVHDGNGYYRTHFGFELFYQIYDEDSEWDEEKDEFLDILFSSIINHPYPMIMDYDYSVNIDSIPMECNDLIRQFVGVTMHCQMIDINDSIFDKRVNKRYPSKKIKNVPYRVNRVVKKNRILIKDKTFYPQGLFDSFIPTVDIGMTSDTRDLLTEVKTMLNGVASNGLTHKIEVPMFDDLLSKLRFCWDNELVRNTLLVVVYICSKIYLKSKPLAVYFSIDILYLYLITTCSEVHKTILLSICAATNALDYLFSESDDIQPQMDVGSLEPLLVPLYSWMYYSAFNREYKGDYVTNFMKECQTIKKAKEGCLDLIDFVINTFGKFTQLLQGRKFSEVFSDNMYPQLDLYATQIDDFMLNFNKGIPFTKEQAMIILQIQADLEKLSRVIPSSNEFSHYKKKSILLGSSLNLFIKEIKKAGLFDDGTRIIPLAILIVGPSGVGKTTNMPQMLFELASLTMDDEMYEAYKKSKDDFQYTYNPENEYFDRYRKQYFCMVDEFGALRDAPSHPNEGYLFTMRAINCWAYPVHMADLSDKGMMFDSKIVIAVGNIKKLMCESLICPEAVSRRFDFSVMLVPKVEFCKVGYTTDPWTRRLDPTLLSGSITDTSHMEFLPYNIVDGKVSGPATSWRDMINSMADMYQKKVKFSKLRIDGVPIMAEYCDNLRKERFHCQMANPEHITIVERMSNIVNRFNESLEPNPAEEDDSPLYKAKQKLTQAISDIQNFCKENVILVGVTASVPIVMAIWHFCRSVIEPQSTFAKPKLTIRAAARRQAKIINSKNKEQMCLANTEFDNVSSCVLKANHYKILGVKSAGYMTFIKGRVAVMPHHYFDLWTIRREQGEIVKFTIDKALHPGSPQEINFDDLSFNEIDENSDLIFCYFPTMYMHRDISKFLMSYDDKLFRSKVHACLARIVEGGVKLHTTEAVPIGAHQYTCYTNDMSYEYRIATRVGECGELLFSTDSRSPTRIMGMHTAGDSKDTGISVALYKEDFDASFEAFCDEGKEHIDVLVENDFIEYGPQMRGLDSKFCTIRKISNVNLPVKSQIIKTPLHNAWHESIHEPVVLRKQNGYDPWKCRTAYCGPSKSMDLGLLAACRKSIFSTLLKEARKDFDYPGVMDIKTAIQGIPGRYKGIPRSTALGYIEIEGEHFKMRNSGKHDLFGSQGDYDFYNSNYYKFEKHIEDCDSKIRSCQKVNFPFTDFLKDERRKKGKDPRMVSASPTDYTTLCRMYFGSVCMWIMDNRIHNGICVGVNPFSEEWNVMAKSMLSVGNNNIFGDFKGYDTSLICAVLYEVKKFMEMFFFWLHKHHEKVLDNYDSSRYQGDVNARNTLFESFVNSHHIAILDGKVVIYDFVGSVSSGHALTTFVNSIANIILIRYCICLIKYGYDDFNRYPNILPDFEELDANYRVLTFGDDNGISVSEEYSLLINQQTMTEAMSKIGMVYTSEDKSDTIYTHRKLSECSFLKCTFRYDPELRRYVAAQALSSILDMPYWTKVNCKEPESVQITVDLLLAKLSLWGRDIYSDWAPRIIEKSIKILDHSPIRQEYDENVSYILSYEAEFY